MEAVSPFHPKRYPTLRAIVDGDDSTSQTLTDKVSDTLLKQIIRGELPVGSQLKSTQIAQQLGVSRTPVTRALAKLTVDGILTQPNSHQAIVAQGAADWLVQIHELRELLEPEAAYRAAGQLPAEVIEDLRALAQDSQPTPKYDWSQAAQYLDFGLHLAIAEYCGNLPMRVSIRRCWSYKRVSYDLSEGCRSELETEYQQHIEILRAMVEGDAARARELVRLHLTAASEGRFTSQVI
ncbi:GntR family transcriptional regulator [Aeoliella mucimassa]|uniref:GntR family transcriptional regulator n=1 Tax=Aeoliella mucimassa TaxID=2527972 RepID=UPI0011A3A7CD|nr:GntR family transcriptional regulator [Aeoliella mucimassa]